MSVQDRLLLFVGARWKICRCPQWDERRPFTAPEQRIDAQFGRGEHPCVVFSEVDPVQPRPQNVQVTTHSSACSCSSTKSSSYRASFIRAPVATPVHPGVPLRTPEYHVQLCLHCQFN
ncbi:hypothetical protein BKA82DRAFT_1003285 [Pisolithus tinctorius]|uniref:Uncharacterized protein n=1 Tax=Pisolithus tinctorius Marx 270 TaxID=870435 RepID=A0A0C3P0X1_PISTI|nr:hypothetical protein BKA82DRAFT_1003285 [Pisolithus tinctorius]KIO00999.1 hypothetical protein M404DRAFT_1003285 [Pisolithus tinctorius Marx 270]